MDKRLVYNFYMKIREAKVGQWISVPCYGYADILHEVKYVDENVVFVRQYTYRGRHKLFEGRGLDNKCRLREFEKGEEPQW